ncbi:alpha/beta fold hydrolase [Marimonas arenosa]|uniref:Alpha/beta hydrolase n=1 Tax=Marimonas arenosa TaxID=1795305 RepID=A0AAE4B6B4_9RHOB|nr:alpha/beta hydrolase [Marimonas arenosa]MDQ2092002.1 alpha/beta hydrolase [Marimonas arenosa]
MWTRRAMLGGLGALGLAAGSYAAGSFRATLASARRRLTQRSQLAETRFGPIEFARAGDGTRLLMVHGTGGGFDQGLRFGQGLIERGFEIIAPSRFGYLRSAFPDQPSPDNQADAFADLLDHLQIERIAVAGGSAGALPAAAFARRHPDRCSRLILMVPAANLSGRDPVEFTALQQFLVRQVLTSDFWFWSLATLAPERMFGTLLATDPVLLDRVSPAERERAHLILTDLMPIAPRARGMMNDGYFSGHPTDLDFAAITAPTLILSAEDDRFGTAETARLIAARVPGARLVIYPDGGHIWLGHDADLAREIAEFVGPSPPG